MILINELNGNVIFKGSISITGNVITKKEMLTGNIVCGGARTFPSYTGDYTVTPSQETQILLTKNTRLTDNITVNPIPNNYGLITWNGSYITVS